MTKEYENRKKEGKRNPWFIIFEIFVSLCVCFVGALFLLMVIFPQGDWVYIFKK